MDSRITVQVRLVDEGTDVWRPTEAIERGQGLFELLATSNYDLDGEEWEFPAGSIVRVEKVRSGADEYFRAISRE